MLITKKQTALFVLPVISILLFAIVQVRFTLAQQIGTQQQFEVSVSSVAAGVQSSANLTHSKSVTAANDSKQTYARLGSRLAEDLPTGETDKKTSGLMAEAETALSEFTDLSEENSDKIEDLGRAKTVSELGQKWQRLRPELDAAADKVEKAVDAMEEVAETLKNT